MPAPAALPPLPIAPSAPGVPASAPGDDVSPCPFDQHLQAARNAQAADTTPSSNPPNASDAARAAADAQGGAAAADANGKPAQEPNMSKLASAAAAPAANSAAATGAPSASPAQADATLIDSALATAQAASAAAGAGAATVAKAVATKAAEPDSQAVASLAGTMLAMLGQISGAATGVAAAEADGGKVSADGAASGRGKATGVLLQATAQDGQPGNAMVGASVAGLANALGNAAGMPTVASAGAHKDHALDALALVTSPAPTATPRTLAPVAPALQLSSAPGSAGFAGELGQQVVWLAQQGVQQAKVRLHPEDLGALDVKLSVSHGRVDVMFSAQHPAAVTAVQQSLTQLDHMLSQHGLALGHAEVGQQQGHGHGHARGDSDASTAADESSNAQSVASMGAATSRIGLLDAFA